MTATKGRTRAATDAMMAAAMGAANDYTPRCGAAWNSVWSEEEEAGAPSQYRVRGRDGNSG